MRRINVLIENIVIDNLNYYNDNLIFLKWVRGSKKSNRGISNNIKIEDGKFICNLNANFKATIFEKSKNPGTYNSKSVKFYLYDVNKSDKEYLCKTEFELNNLKYNDESHISSIPIKIGCVHAILTIFTKVNIISERSLTFDKNVMISDLNVVQKINAHFMEKYKEEPNIYRFRNLMSNLNSELYMIDKYKERTLNMCEELIKMYDEKKRKESNDIKVPTDESHPTIESVDILENTLDKSGSIDDIKVSIEESYPIIENIDISLNQSEQILDKNLT